MPASSFFFRSGHFVIVQNGAAECMYLPQNSVCQRLVSVRSP